MQTSNARVASHQTETPVWTLGQHIPHLDGVRGLAILIVTLYRFAKELPHDTGFDKALYTLFLVGNRGVDLFFVLSGFLITGILLDSKGQKHFFRNFMARRSLRIFPLYFAAIFLFVLLIPAVTRGAIPFQMARENQFYLWTYLANVKMSIDSEWCFGYLDHFWSLCVEEHFYLLWPAIIFVCSRPWGLRLAITLAGVSSLSRIVYSVLGASNVAPDVLTIFRCDALLIGAILAFLIRTESGLKPWLKFSRIALCAAAPVALVIVFIDKRVLTISHTLWPVIWAALLIELLTSSRGDRLAKFFSSGLLGKLGKYSYAMYVFQSPLIPLTTGVLSASILSEFFGSTAIGSVLYITLMCVLSYGAALLSWHLLEKHCLRLKSLFPTSPRGQAYKGRTSMDNLRESSRAQG